MLAIKKTSISALSLLAIIIAIGMAVWFAPKLITCANQARWHALYQDGQQALEAHDYDKGISLWSQILREMPSTGADSVGYADIAIQLERFLQPKYPFVTMKANPEKERLLRSACEIYARELGVNSSEAVTARDELSTYLQMQKRYEEASSLIRYSIFHWKKSGEKNAVGYSLYRRLSLIFAEENRYTEATKASEEMLAEARKLNYQGVALSIPLNFLGCDYIRSRQYEKAIAVLTEAMECETSSNHAPVIPMCNLARAYDGMGRTSDSISTFKKALVLLYKTDITGNWKTAETELQLALVYVKAKQYSNAEPLLRHVIKFAKDQLTKVNLEHSEYDKRILVKDCNLYLNPAQAALAEIEHGS